MPSYGKTPSYVMGWQAISARPYQKRTGVGAQFVVHGERARLAGVPARRGLQSSTFRLNVSAVYGNGGAFRASAGGVYEVLEGIWGC